MKNNPTDILNPEEQHWTKVITSVHHSRFLNLKEIWAYKDLIALFVNRDMAANYKQTILGPLWHFINPLLTTILFVIIFHYVAKVPTNGTPPLLFYLSGIVFWNLFTGVLNQSSNVFTTNAAIFGKVYFPRLTAPIASVITEMVKFCFQLVILLICFGVFVAFFGFRPEVHLTLLLLPVFALMIAMFAFGLGCVFASVSTKYKDISMLLGFFTGLFMYATPIIYPISRIPESKQWIWMLNPLAPIMELFRLSFLGAGNVTMSQFGQGIVVILIVFFGGLYLFHLSEKNFVDTI